MRMRGWAAPIPAGGETTGGVLTGTCPKSLEDLELPFVSFPEVVELAAANSIFARARHPYTNLLARTVPRRGDGIFAETQGELPDPLNPPQGCAFRARCPNSGDICMNLNPVLHKGKAGAHVACHFADED